MTYDTEIGSHIVGQQLHRLLRVCTILASPLHHRQEGAEPGQDHSADAKG